MVEGGGHTCRDGKRVGGRKGWKTADGWKRGRKIEIYTESKRETEKEERERERVSELIEVRKNHS